MRYHDVAAVVAVLMVLIAGCGSPQTSSNGPSTVPATDTGAAPSTPATDSARSTPSNPVTYEVVVSYGGEWSATVETGSTTRTVDGSGTTTIPVDGSPDTVTVRAEKRDGGTGTLTVTIRKNGEAVSTSSTNARSGTISMTHSEY